MIRTTIVLILLALVAVFTTNVAAAEGLVKTVVDGFKVELEKYCGQVTPGQGRILDCLYAHGDKLSAKCEFALYDSAVRFERAVAALSYAANECDDDLEKYCSSIEPGEGRLLDCLEKHNKDVSGRCKEALKTVGLK